MIIDCPYCAARVDAKVIATHEDTENPGMEHVNEADWLDDYPGVEEEILVNLTYRATLLVCTLCHYVLLAYQVNKGAGLWSAPERVYPPEQGLHFPLQIPEGIRDSLEEASRCLKAEAYRSTAVQCRRAVEGLCRHFHAGASLGNGLSELRNRGIIDGMLLQWAEALRLHGNIGAHPDPATISKDDAADLFDFAFAVCQYVFVLGDKFRKFRERTDPGGQCATTVQ